MSENVEWLRKAARCIHIAVEPAVANDIAAGMTKAANELERYRNALLEIEPYLHSQTRQALLRTVNEALGRDNEPMPERDHINKVWFIMGTIVFIFAMGWLVSCSTPSKCGVPYTPEEDATGIEHRCPEGRN